MGKHYYPWLIKPEWLAYTIMDNGKLAADLKLPVFQVHGDKDEIIPFEQGETLHAAFAGPKQFLRLEGVMHNNIWQDEARTRRIDQAMDEFLDKHAP
jgi:pimeloyl-ACP methyl ester carboxylesterase